MLQCRIILLAIEVVTIVLQVVAFRSEDSLITIVLFAATYSEAVGLLLSISYALPKSNQSSSAEVSRIQIYFRRSHAPTVTRDSYFAPIYY